MGGQNSGRSAGARDKKVYSFICKFIDCKEPFTSTRSNAEYCCDSCAYNARKRRLMIASGEVVRCRFCGETVPYQNLKKHFKQKHEIVLK